MPHAIARIAKLNSGNIASSEQHTKRVRSTPNANPEIKNIRLGGQPETSDSPTLDTLVRQRIGEQTIRKNAVLCVEMLLTASPEYFRPDDPSRAGYYQPQRLEDFQTAVHQWLDEQYGERIVRAELHLDEATPHIHAYLVPLDERGKLNCRGLFGGREKLSKFQDSYAEALSPLMLLLTRLERLFKQKPYRNSLHQFQTRVNGWRSKSSRSNEITRQSQLEQKRDRGLSL